MGLRSYPAYGQCPQPFCHRKHKSDLVCGWVKIYLSQSFVWQSGFEDNTISKEKIL